MAFRSTHFKQQSVPVLNPLFQTVLHTHHLEVLKLSQALSQHAQSYHPHPYWLLGQRYSTVANVSLVSQVRILSFFSTSLSAAPPHPPPARVCVHAYTHTHIHTSSWVNVSTSTVLQSPLRPHHLHVSDSTEFPLVIQTELLNVMCLWTT